MVFFFCRIGKTNICCQAANSIDLTKLLYLHARKNIPMQLHRYMWLHVVSEGGFYTHAQRGGVLTSLHVSITILELWTFHGYSYPLEEVLQA